MARCAHKENSLPTLYYEYVYTREHVVTFKSKLWLRIQLAGKEFLLPMVNVGTPEKSKAIGYLDPHPKRNPHLARAAADAMAGLLQKVHAGVVIMPSSSKSEWFINRAVKQVRGATFITLPGDTDRDKVLKLSEAGSVISYTPVTGTEKFMGLPLGFVEMFRRARERHGGNVVLADDVKTTGSTIRAMEIELMPTFSGGLRYQVATLAYEAALDQNYPPPVALGSVVSIAIPEVTGYSSSVLIPIADRQTVGIPQAISV